MGGRKGIILLNPPKRITPPLLSRLSGISVLITADLFAAKHLGNEIRSLPTRVGKDFLVSRYFFLNRVSISPSNLRASNNMPPRPRCLPSLCLLPTQIFMNFKKSPAKKEMLPPPPHCTATPILADYRQDCCSWRQKG